VVHVNDAQSFAETEFEQNMEENDRVATAGQPDTQQSIASFPRGEKRSDPARNIT
jgi:hypothetical protein